MSGKNPTAIDFSFAFVGINPSMSAGQIRAALEAATVRQKSSYLINLYNETANSAAATNAQVDSGYRCPKSPAGSMHKQRAFCAHLRLPQRGPSLTKPDGVQEPLSRTLRH